MLRNFYTLDDIPEEYLIKPVIPDPIDDEDCPDGYEEDNSNDDNEDNSEDE